MNTTEKQNTGVSPLPNSVRSEFFDDLGQSYYTEWQWLPPGTGARTKPARRVAVVTGARPEGTGEATAAELALRHGFHVVLAERDATLGEQVAARIVRLGGAVTFVQADVTREADVSRIMDAAADAGQLDVLVNNASDASDPARDNILD